jgi:galactokinase
MVWMVVCQEDGSSKAMSKRMSLVHRDGFLYKYESFFVVVTNSNVKHDIAGGEYPVWVAQCKTVTAALAKVNPSITSLRKATLEEVEKAKDLMDEVSYKRAKHVVTENGRTLRAKEALEQGNWKLVGELMDASHTSMRDDYEVSCEEIDILVELAHSYAGAHGSRLTGGGFVGCTVTFVAKENASGLIQSCHI